MERLRLGPGVLLHRWHTSIRDFFQRAVCIERNGSRREMVAAFSICRVADGDLHRHEPWCVAHTASTGPRSAASNRSSGRNV